MAQKTTKKNATPQRRTSARPKAQSSASKSFQTEIILLLVTGACVLLEVGNFGLGGFVGNTISKAMFGLMGVLCYGFPVVIFISAILLFANRFSKLSIKKVFYLFLLLFCICGLVQRISEGYLSSMTVADYFDRSSVYHTGGGVFGGLVCISTISAFGEVGSYIILVLVTLVSLIEVTQRSFFGFVFRMENKMIRFFRRRGDHAMSKEEKALRKEQKMLAKEQRRQEKQEARIAKLEQKLAEEEAELGLDEEEDEDSENQGMTAEEKAKAEKRRRFALQIPDTFSKLSPNSGEDDDDDEEDDDEPKYKGLNGMKNRFKNALLTDIIEEPDEDDDEEEDDYDDPVRVAPGRKSTRLKPKTTPKSREKYVNDDELAELQEARRKFAERGTAKTNTRNIPPSAFDEDDYDDDDGEDDSRSSVKNPRSSQKEIEAGIRNIASEIQGNEEKAKPAYHYPPLKLLKKGDGRKSGESSDQLQKTARKLEETLRNFGVNVTVTNVSCGPTVTQYELQPEMGVKVSRIVSLADDIKLNLATPDIRIEAPIPGKAAVGIEVPNKENSAVMLRDLLQSNEFQGASSSLSFAVGKDIAGKPIVADIAKMPHLLIAGSTGSGKSVCINTLIASILYKASPDEVKLIMIDPKVVELSVYNGIPHLYIPVVTDPKKASGALNWAVQEMTRRYNTFAEYNVRKLEEYNHKVEQMRVPEGETRPDKMPRIVIIVDELADLMMVAPGEVEDAIVRLTQLARAAGIHLVIATQRPSVNVITGLIKANMPSRIAFAVSSGVDSRVILDMNGAEKLLGKGDMLFYPQGYSKPARLQGAFISDDEVSAIVDFLSNKNPQVEYNAAIAESVNTAMAGGGAGASSERDVYFEEAGRFIIEKDKASIGMLQRVFKIGFNRAARIMDQLADAGVVGPEEGTKPRKVLMSESQFEAYLEEH